MPTREPGSRINRNTEDSVKWNKIGAMAFVTFLMFYLTIGFIVWDIAWIEDMSTWSPFFRFILAFLIFICVCIGGIYEVCTRED